MITNLIIISLCIGQLLVRKNSNWQVREKKCGMHQWTQENIHVMQHLNFHNDLQKKKIISHQMTNTLHHKSLQKTTTTTIYKLSLKNSSQRHFVGNRKSWASYHHKHFPENFSQDGQHPWSLRGAMQWRLPRLHPLSGERQRCRRTLHQRSQKRMGCGRQACGGCAWRARSWAAWLWCWRLFEFEPYSVPTTGSCRGEVKW